MSAMVSSLPPPYQEDFGETPPPRYGDANSIITSKSEEEQCNMETSEEIQVNLIDNNSSAPYTVGDLVLADLIVLPKEDLHVDEIVVAFSLVISCVCHRGTVISRRHNKRAIVIHRIREEDLPEDRIFRSEFKYTFPLSISVPERLPNKDAHCMQCSQSHSLLPPSLGARYDYPPHLYHPADMPGAIARVTYGLRAALFKGNQKVRDHFQQLNFQPRYPSTDLVSPPPVPNMASKTFKKGLLFKKSSTGELTVTNVGRLLFNRAERTNNPTLLALSMGFTSTTNVSPPPAVQRVTCLFQAVTRVHPYGAAWANVDVVSKQAFELKDTKWRPTPNSPTIKNQFEYQTGVHVPIFSPCDEKTVVPSFSTCSLTREYRIEVKVHTDQDSITLHVPVTVIDDPYNS